MISRSNGSTGYSAPLVTHAQNLRIVTAKLKYNLHVQKFSRWPLRSNGTINNGKKVEWPVEQVDGLVMQTDIRVYCLLSSSLSLEPTRLNPPVKPKEIFAMAAKFPYRCLSFHYSSEAKNNCDALPASKALLAPYTGRWQREAS